MPTRRKGFWKCSKSLTSNAEYVEKIENQFLETLCMLDQDKMTDKHISWEYLKYENRKFTINFSKNLFKEENKRTKKTWKKPNFQPKPNFQTNQYSLECKKKFQKIYTKKVNGIRIMSKCNW